MENPWKEFAQRRSDTNMILECEKALIEDFNKQAKEKHKIPTAIFPAPFVGNVLDPQVVLLTNNPGYDYKEADRGFYKNAEVRRMFFDNMINADQSFFCLEKRYIEMSPYWDVKLKPVIEVVGREKTAKGISVIEFFPYHSVKYKSIPKQLIKKHFTEGNYLPSQLYNFESVRQAMERGAIIIIQRGETRWKEAIPELTGKACRTNSYGNPVISSNNLPAGIFDRIVEKLRSL